MNNWSRFALAVRTSSTFYKSEAIPMVSSHNLHQSLLLTSKRELADTLILFYSNHHFLGSVARNFPGVIISPPSDKKSGRFKAGDRIFGLAQGAFAQQVCVKEANLQAIPEGWSFKEASALYLTGPTGYAVIVTRARIQLGDWALIHSAAGGIGLSAVQVAKAHGARVIATSTGRGLDACKNYGADHLIDYASTAAWDKEVLKITSGHGADVVFDPVGMISKTLKCAAFEARLVCIGFVGREIEAIKMNRILLKNVNVVGLHWGAYIEFQPETIGKVWESLFGLIREGRFRRNILG